MSLEITCEVNWNALNLPQKGISLEVHWIPCVFEVTLEVNLNEYWIPCEFGTENVMSLEVTLEVKIEMPINLQ